MATSTTAQTQCPDSTATNSPRVKCGHCGNYETAVEVFWCSQFDPVSHIEFSDESAEHLAYA